MEGWKYECMNACINNIEKQEKVTRVCLVEAVAVVAQSRNRKKKKIPLSEDHHLVSKEKCKS
jgi:hypothetical protein